MLPLYFCTPAAYSRAARRDARVSRSRCTRAPKATTFASRCRRNPRAGGEARVVDHPEDFVRSQIAHLFGFRATKVRVLGCSSCQQGALCLEATGRSAPDAHADMT